MDRRKLVALGMVGGGGGDNTIYLDISSLADGAMPEMSGAFSIISGAAYNTGLVLGGELLSNGNMETGSPPSDWGSSHSGVLTADVNVPADGGVQSLKITNGATDDGRATQNESLTIGVWYRLYGEAKAGTTGCLYVLRQTIALNVLTLASGGWAAINVSVRSLATVVSQAELSLNSTTLGRTGFFDNVSLKAIITSSMFFVKQVVSQYGTIKASWTKGTNTACPMGVVMCADYPTMSNFVIAYLINSGGSSTLRMDKCVNGVYTNIISTPTTYLAGKTIEIRRIHETNTFQAFYNGVQVGANQTVADASIIDNRYHGGFDSSPQLNSVSKVFYSALFTPKTISILGDSISASATGYQLYLRDFYKCGINTLQNHAVSGHIIMTNMDADVVAAESDNADVIILALGTNDDNAGDMNALQAEVEENLAELKVSNPNAEIYYMNILPRWTNVGGETPVDKSNLRTTIAAACAAQGITCWNTVTDPWITAADTDDGLHPNTLGNNKILARMLGLLL